MAEKIIRDPIYGYIEIEDDFVKIIDSATFQRLRRICQSSYSPLYPSALHNRFTHSLGVFHLGKMALKTLKKEIKEKSEILEINNEQQKDIDDKEKLFLAACLLHDVGHAPFSHIGEKYYLEPNQAMISDKLDKEIGKSIYPGETKRAAEHEIMSATVGIKSFGKKWSPDEREFFARCITGYKYEDSEDDVNNCLISLLNSNTIDVDRVDYLIRDSYVTGFPNSPIDYERLLKNITVVKHEGKICLAYKKNAMSTLENVVYARDSEKKWIQAHPTILYENYIIQRSIKLMNSQYSSNESKHIMCYESLTTEGEKYDGGSILRMFSDDDVIHAMKYTEKVKDDCLIEEYFERRNRRRPVWKSEFEYNAICSHYITDVDRKSILDMLKTLLSTCNHLKIAVINGDALLKMETYMASLDGTDENTKGVKSNLKKHISFLEKLHKELLKINEGFDLIFITTDSFTSGFSNGAKKSELEKTLVEFKNLPSPMELGKVMPTLVSKSSENNKTLFYPFWKGKSDNKGKFIEALIMAVKATQT